MYPPSFKERQTLTIGCLHDFYLVLGGIRSYLRVSSDRIVSVDFFKFLNMVKRLIEESDNMIMMRVETRSCDQSRREKDSHHFGRAAYFGIMQRLL